MTYAGIDIAARDAGLIVMGALDNDIGTLVLLGTGSAFWPVFSASVEFHDGQHDPVDRWSRRIVGRLAQQMQADALYPFGNPPYKPFIKWAKQSGRAFSGPTGMLVHDTVGMMISYRGALQFAETFPFPDPAHSNPCPSCTGQPCATACPVGALSDAHSYQVDKCHAYLDTDAGQRCMTRGCAARRVCPINQQAPRDPAQSALHMKAFHQP